MDSKILKRLSQLSLLGYISLVNGVEIGTGTGEGSGSGGSLFTAESALMSVAILCTIVFVAIGCTWAWWKRVFCFWRPHGTHEAPPDWFIPGSATGTGTDSPFTTLSASNLQRDVDGRGGRSSTNVTIEPLPNLSELGLDGRDSFELKAFRPPAIVSPSASITGQLDVSDWFENEERGFPRQNLEYQKIIGKGWFGKVLEAEAVNIKPYVRVSNVIVRELRNNANEEDQQQFLIEARMFRDAYRQQGAPGSENILKLLGYCIDQLPYILVFEYYPLGDLKSYLKTRAKQAPGGLKPGDDGILTRMIIDVIRGVKWMAQNDFVHGDLSARNCLVATSAGKVIIGDYGCSTQKYKADYFWNTNRAIPIRWAAPETLQVEDESPPLTLQTLQITHESNIWSLGIVIWEIFQLAKMPYESFTDEEVVRKVIIQGYVLEPPQLPFVNANTREKIYQLLVRCWNSTPNLRPTIEEIEQVFTTPTPSTSNS